MSNNRKSIFIGPDGKNLAFTFALVSSLFLLWGFCNGMIDVMDKHFQEELGLTKSQSAWVQFAHYLGYFLMSMPAGWLAAKLGYKGGIISGLLIVAVGGFWFIPATHIAAFWAFLLGVCIIASRPHLSGNHRQSLHHRAGRSALRRHPHQSRAVLQWHRLDVRTDRRRHVLLLQRRGGTEHRQPDALHSLRSPSAVIVIVLAVIFYFANVPDIKMEDDYHLDDADAERAPHSIWSHPHFVLAVAAQFFYVAAQAGIFSFFINYMTSADSADPDRPGTRAGSAAGLKCTQRRRPGHQQQGRRQPRLPRLRAASWSAASPARPAEKILRPQDSSGSTASSTSGLRS